MKVIYVSMMFTVLAATSLISVTTQDATTFEVVVETETAFDSYTDDGMTTVDSNGGDGSVTTMITPDGSTFQCLVCTGLSNQSECYLVTDASDSDSMYESITVSPSCTACTIELTYWDDSIETVNRSCIQDSACPSDLESEEDFKCTETNSVLDMLKTIRECQWCCAEDRCNDYSPSGGRRLAGGALNAVLVALSALMATMLMGDLGANF